MRLVFDTNVIISAALFAKSEPGQAFRKALHSDEILLSFAVLVEVNEVITRPKFARYIGADEAQEFLAALVSRATFVDVVDEVTACRDPKDNKFLELALSGIAAIIVSGDRDLQTLNPFQGIRILSPSEFLRGFGFAAGG